MTQSANRERVKLEKEYLRETERKKRAAEVASLYEKHDGSHKDVAQELAVSLALATKLIAYARKHGFITRPKRGSDGPKSDAQRTAEFRARQRAAGKCIQHAQRKARPGSSLCEECLAAHADSMTRMRKK